MPEALDRGRCRMPPGRPARPSALLTQDPATEQPAPPTDGVGRHALLGTPRSGNTWLRRLLAAAHGLEQFAVHRPEELDWAGLPARFIVQLHRKRQPSLLDLLDRHGVR